MQTNKKRAWVWGLFGLYLLIVTQIILVKEPRFFVWRIGETLRRHHYDWVDFEANYHPFKTIWHMLFVDFRFMVALQNIGGNILLFIPLGIFLPAYFNAPNKTLKTIATSFCLSSSFELIQLVTACGFFDVDDIFLNTLGGATGLWMYSLFITHSNYTQKKLVVTYAPK